ncbi:DUF4129 domain-containing protein [Chloroflexota bacterium]
MRQRTKTIGLLFLLGVLVSLILLTASLSNFQLHSGIPFPAGLSSDNAGRQDMLFPVFGNYTVSILRGVIALIFIITMIYVPLRIILSVDLKIILRTVFVMGLLLLIIYVIYHLALILQFNDLYSSSEITTLPTLVFPDAPLGQPPQVFIWVVITAIVMGIGLPAILLLIRRQGTSQTGTGLLQEAEDAVNAIQTGMDLKNVIMRCYLQMSHLLQEEQGIERKYAMTAREFEAWLEFMGFPPSPVHQLTNLFEMVRYGEYQTSENDEKIALASLKEIIRYGRSVRID